MFGKELQTIILISGFSFQLVFLVFCPINRKVLGLLNVGRGCESNPDFFCEITEN